MGEGQCEREERETAEAQPIPLREAWTRLMTEIATRIPNHLKSTQFYEAINDVEGGVRVAERRSDAARPVERYAPDQIEGVTMDRDKWRTRAIALEGEIAKLRTAEADRRESAPIPEDHRMKVAHKDEELPNACPARFGDLKCIFVAGHSHYHMGGSETWNDGEVAPAPGLAELPSFGACPESEDLRSSSSVSWPVPGGVYLSRDDYDALLEVVESAGRVVRDASAHCGLDDLVHHSLVWQLKVAVDATSQFASLAPKEEP